MASNISDPIVPKQEEGASSDTTASKTLSNIDEAKSFFKTVCKRLNNVNDWKKYSGSFTADFHLCDEKGNDVSRTMQLHDHFRIDGPGPGPVAGEGYDWVQVEAIEENESEEGSYFSVRVRPVSNPLNEKEDIAHFFTDDSTSSFIIRRKGNTVYAEVHGRNEQPNIAAENLFDKARNAVAGAVAAAFYSKFEWRNLVNGLVNYEESL
jgi:hypothetical protein